MPPSFRKKIGALCRKRFSENPLFTTFSLSLTVSEVCIKIIGLKLFLHKTPDTATSFQQKNCSLHWTSF